MSFGTYGLIDSKNQKIIQNSPCVVCHLPFDTRVPQFAFECISPKCQLKTHAPCISKWVVEQGNTTCPYCKTSISKDDLNFITSSTDSRVIRLEHSVQRIDANIEKIFNLLSSKNT